MMNRSSLDSWVLRFTWGCGGIVLLAIVGPIAFVACVYGSQHRSFVPAAMAVVGCAALAVLGREVLRRWPPRERRVDRSAEPVPLADLEPGRVLTAGLVGVGTEPKPAPFGAPPCVFYRVVIELDDPPGGVLYEGQSADELVLEDGAGAKVIVHLEGAKWKLRRSRDLVSTPATPHEDVVAFLASRGLPVSQPVRACVEWLAPHELVYVRGRVEETHEGTTGYRSVETSRRDMASTATEPLIIALEPIDA
jgi:hypothetical protein